MHPQEKRTSMAALAPVIIMAFAVPMALMLWLGNMAFSFFTAGHEHDTVISPTRWLVSTLLPILIAVWGLKKRSLNISGALFGLLVGFVLTLSSYCFLACLLTFFVTSSKATKFRADKKKKMEKQFKEGGQRNWLQVLCNGGLATELALLYIIDSGCGERPVDFASDYRASWLGLGILGTNGGVTVGGLIVSLLGGLAVGGAYYVAVSQCVDSSVLLAAPPQWPLLVAGAMAGLLGSLLDSVLGATLQFSGVEDRTGCIVEVPGKGVKHVSGVQVMDNHSVNLVSSICMGFFTPWLANLLWP
ncbi:hypothetical protein B566_EDAN004313 [Ephemera danica]|nr:hypothetical protein B566_EDAN004313 [Ephemera danica]